MKKDRTRLIIGILLSLVLFSSSLGLWFYLKEEELNKKVQHLRYVYVISKDVKKNQKITNNDIELKKLPKEVVTWEVLTKDKILHMYAKENLYKGEPVLASKLSKSPILKKEKKIIELKTNNDIQTKISYKGDTLTIPLSSFQNIDPWLKKGDKIDILSVDFYPERDSRNNKYKPYYIAIGVEIVSFGYGTQRYDKATKEIYEQDTHKKVLADSITLSVNPKNLNNLIQLYYKTKSLNAKRAYNQNNKGHLWIVKNNSNNEEILKQKEKMLLSYKKKRVVKKRKRKSTNYTPRIEYEK